MCTEAARNQTHTPYTWMRLSHVLGEGSVGPHDLRSVAVRGCYAVVAYAHDKVFAVIASYPLELDYRGHRREFRYTSSLNSANSLQPYPHDQTSVAEGDGQP